MGHYIENTGKGTLHFSELLKSDYYADISLNQYLANTPSERVRQHLHLDDEFMNNLSLKKTPVIK